MQNLSNMTDSIFSFVVRNGKLVHQAKSDWGLDIWEFSLDNEVVTVKMGDSGYFKKILFKHLEVNITYKFGFGDVVTIKFGHDKALENLFLRLKD